MSPPSWIPVMGTSILQNDLEGGPLAVGSDVEVGVFLLML